MILWYSDVVNSLSTFLSQCFENASSLASQTLDAFQLSLSSVLFIAIIISLCKCEMSTKVMYKKSDSGENQRGLGHLSLSTVMLGLMIFFSSILCSSGNLVLLVKLYSSPNVGEFYLPALLSPIKLLILVCYPSLIHDSCCQFGLMLIIHSILLLE